MKRLIFIFIFFCIVKWDLSHAQQSSFAGEQISYKLAFSIFNIGKAKFFINDLDSAKGDSYRMVVNGETSGLVGVFSKIEDEWGAQVFKDSFLPSFSYRRIREGNYKKDEDVSFGGDTITLRQWDFSQKKYKEPVHYGTEETAIYEFLSGLLYVRALDFSDFKIDQKIKFKAFFDGDFFDFEVLYKGKEKIKTKLGKKQAIKLVPVMPKNSLFDGENPITMWISDDDFKVPLKVHADFRYIGIARVEITKYSNPNHTLDNS